MELLGKILSYIYPWAISIFIIIILLTIPFDISHKVKNFSNVLESVVIFSSIIVGFLGALLGILITIKNSKIIKEIDDNNEMRTVRYFFNESLILGFVVILLSIAFQVLKDYEYDFVQYYFYVWFTITGVFALSSFRIIQLLMNIFFKSNDTNERPESNTSEIDAIQREKMKKNLTKQK